MTTLDPTDDQIHALREEAARAGDHAMIEICDRALEPVRRTQTGRALSVVRLAIRDRARAECARVIAEAQAQNGTPR
jgi:hypothetical protein